MTGLSGIIPPLILPRTDGGEIDRASLARQVEFLLAAGVNGLWVNGTTGEFYALEPAERAAVVREVVRLVGGRAPIVAQVGDAATRRAMLHVHAAVDAGADYLAAVAPYYVVFSQAELLSYYHSLAAATLRPLVIYQLPQMTKVGLTVENVLALARAGSAVAIKDSSGDMTFYRQLTQQVQAGAVPLRCFVGGGSLVDISLLMGGHGAMCAIANLAPRQCVALYQAARAGDWSTASRRQLELQRFIDTLHLPNRPHWATTIAVYKWLLKAQGIITSDAAAEPLAPLTVAEQQHLETQALPRLRQMEGAHVERALR